MPWPRLPVEPRFIMREAILEYLDDLEDIYLADKRLEELRAGHGQPVPLDRITRRYGLGD